MLEKSRNAVFFQWVVCRVSRKVGLLKRRVRSQMVSGYIKNCTPLWRKAHSEVKMLKNWGSGRTFRRSDVQKLHAAVVKSTFGSENVKKPTIRDHFLKFRCWIIVRGCGEKHIRKWKCTKHHIPRALLEVLMSKKCTTLWRKAHFEVKMYKTRQFWTTFQTSDAAKLRAAVAKSTFGSQNAQNTSAADSFRSFWNLRCRKMACASNEKHLCQWRIIIYWCFRLVFQVQMSNYWLQVVS